MLTTSRCCFNRNADDTIPSRLLLETSVWPNSLVASKAGRSGKKLKMLLSEHYLINYKQKISVTFMLIAHPSCLATSRSSCTLVQVIFLYSSKNIPCISRSNYQAIETSHFSVWLCNAHFAFLCFQRFHFGFGELGF